jgi:hypothetical protein
MVRSLLGKFCLDSKQIRNQEGEVLKLTKAVGATENHDCNCGQWSERLVIQDPAVAANEFCSRMARPVNEIML